MKITFITSWVQVTGGLEVHTVHLMNRLQMRGHELTVVEFDSDYYRNAQIDRKESIRFVRVDINEPTICNVGLMQAIAVLSRVRGDVCVFPKGYFRAGNFVLDVVARLLFKRYVTIEHLASPPPEKASGRYLGGMIPGVGLWWYRVRLARWLRGIGPSQVICVSDMVRGPLEAAGFPTDKVITVRNGIDPQRFVMNPEMRSLRRSEWGASPDTLVFGAIGRLETIKGYDVVIPLFARLLGQYPGRELMLVLIGEGKQADSLRGLIREHGIEDKVRLLGPTARPWEFYPAIDVFVMPSRNEGLPFALLEAMASGCVPIAMGVGGVPEVITTPETGWLVPAGDEAGFYDAMMQAVEKGHAGLSEMGKSARALVVSHFNADQQYGKIADLLEMADGRSVEELRAG